MGICEFLLAVIIQYYPALLESGTHTEGGWTEFVSLLQVCVNVVVDFLIFRFYCFCFFFEILKFLELCTCNLLCSCVMYGTSPGS